jgi:hypothetical protein
MTALPRWRRLAVTLARHAAQVLPGARSPWHDAMQCELDYIKDDGAALRWALGCVVASYKTRLARPGITRFITARDVLRHVAACAALMLVIGFALLEQAESQTERPPPAADEMGCETPDASHPAAPTSTLAHETACTGRDVIVRVRPEYPAR